MSVVVRDDAGVRVIELHRPDQRNALSRAMLGEITRAARDPAGMRAVVLTGTNDTFSAGADLAELHGTLDDLEVDDAISEAAAALRNAAVPAIAAIEGPCVGAAIEVALSCDVRVASETAAFSLPAARLGLLYNPAALTRFSRLLRRDALSLLLLLGARITARDALALGLATLLVPEGEALTEATSLARSTIDSSGDAVAATKSLLNHVESGMIDADEWETRRRELIAAPYRVAALSKRVSRAT